MISIFKSKDKSDQLRISVLPVEYNRIICKNEVFKVLKITEFIFKSKMKNKVTFVL